MKNSEICKNTTSKVPLSRPSKGKIISKNTMLLCKMSARISAENDCAIQITTSLTTLFLNGLTNKEPTVN